MISIKPNTNKFNKKMIDQLENELCLSFPNEYIEFLEKYNGGIPEENIVISEEAPEFILSIFFGTDLDIYNDLLLCYKTFYGRIPKGCVAVASDVGGNIICLNLSEEKYGYVYFWDHEKELMFEEGKIQLNNLSLIATSFNKFLNMIQEDITNADDLEGYEVEEIWIDPEFLKEMNNEK
ncbi:SMI1/KNR4 family protein [Gottfriedia sp. NPDC058432]|uniref:SMI1/KNR4 family protein n=1 Tax=Gottfriedia sp. NPDC058432 TaxID=3346497 RepID=UPI00364FCFAE